MAIKCPECGSKNVIPILWGLPTSPAFEGADQGEIYLGGCIVSQNDPDSYCKDCTHTFKKRQRLRREYTFSDPKKVFRASTRSEWRKWLSDNFDKEDEVWLVLPKLSSGEKRIPYNDTVEEALCFGWIDSIQRQYDEHHTIQRFSPRRKNSNWAQTNIERLKWLDQQGLLHPSVRGSVLDLIQREFVFPSDIIDELKKDPVVWKNYQAFSEPYKRIRLAFIDDARDRPEEFQKRLKNFIERTRKNKLFGYGGIEKYY